MSAHPSPRENAEVSQTETERRPLSVEKHAAWLESLAASSREFDSIDIELDEMIQIDPYAGDPPSRRSDKEIGKLLSILDSLDNSNGERGTH